MRILAGRTVPKGAGAVFAFWVRAYIPAKEKPRRGRARFKSSVGRNGSADAARADETEGAEGDWHHGVADTRLAFRRSGVPSDLYKIGLREDEQHRTMTLGVEQFRSVI